MAINDTILEVDVTPFPAGTCFSNNQDLANAIAQSLQVIFPGSLTPWNIGSDTPSVDFRDRPWLKTDAVTGTILGVFTWSPFYGAWLQNHWQYNGNNPPTNERRIFVGTLTNLETYDGGEAGTVSDITGPYWVQDTTFNDSAAVGVGTLAVTPGASFTISTPGAGTLSGVGVYFIKPSGRIFDRG